MTTLLIPKPVCDWTEKDGVIRFTVTSDGTTGPQWIERFKAKGFQLTRWSMYVLNSNDFKPTNGVVTETDVLKGVFFEDNDRSTMNIRAEAEKRKLVKPNAEVACLIREKFSDQELEAMGFFWIVVMHEPINDSDDASNLLTVRRSNGGCLTTCYGRLGVKWNRADGFAFRAAGSSSL